MRRIRVQAWCSPLLFLCAFMLAEMGAGIKNSPLLSRAKGSVPCCIDVSSAGMTRCDRRVTGSVCGHDRDPVAGPDLAVRLRSPVTAVPRKDVAAQAGNPAGAGLGGL